jgi:predicted dehydrogenase
MPRLQIALIGCGRIAHHHMRAIQEQIDRAEVVGVVDVDEKRARDFADAHGIPHYYGETDALFQAHRPDLVIIASPSGIHAEQCCHALEAGAHVLCEKPLAGSLAQLDQIESVVQHTGNTCTSVMQWRFGSSGRHVKQLLEQGEFGQPRVGICQTAWYRTPDYYATPWRGKWATELGGVSMTLGIHAMDFFLWLMGEWDEVNAMMGTLDRDIEVENISLAHVRFCNGAMASIINSALSPHQASYIRLDCQKATVELKHLYGYGNDNWTFTLPPSATRTDELKRWQRMPEDKPASISIQFESVLNALEAGKPPWPGVADMRLTIEFLTCLYKSAFTGQPVKRGSIWPDDPFYMSMNGKTGATAHTG